MQSYVQIENAGMVFSTKKGKFTALTDINLNVDQGEFIALIGHSGCGKSTLLNLVAGLLDATDGVLLLANKEIKGPGPERSVVFQNHSLLPWLTAFENVYLAVEKVFGGNEPKAQLKARTAAALELVGLTHASSKLPGEISGGMKQRVGIARALAMEPKVLLMDEPFGALDYQTRLEMQKLLLDLCLDIAPTVLFITHDIDEAVFISDRIYVMSARPGRIAEVLDVKLPRPRVFEESTTDELFVKLRLQVLKALKH